MYDLLLKGGEIVDPSQKLRAVGDVAFEGGRVAKVGGEISPDDAFDVIDVTNKLVTPGLIDLHGHYAYLMEPYAADPDPYSLPFGVTTVVDTGSTGWINFPAFLEYVIRRSETRVFAFISLSAIGSNPAVRYLTRSGLPLVDFAKVEETVDAIEANRDVIIGVKVNLGPHWAKATTAEPALEVAREIADRTGTKIMVHVMQSPIPLGHIFRHLKAGDIITHCFQGDTHNILDGGNEITEEARAAYRAGIVFDTAGFLRHQSIPVTKAALMAGLKPHTISSDRSNYKEEYLERIRKETGIKGLRAYDLLEYMALFYELGMSLEEVLKAVTSNPSAVIGDGNIGTLRSGAKGDAAVLEMRGHKFDFADGLGNQIQVGRSFKPILTVKAGKRWLAN